MHLLLLASRSDALVTTSFLFLLVRHFLLEAMHLLLLASCYYYKALVTRSDAFVTTSFLFLLVRHLLLEAMHLLLLASCFY